MSGEARAVDRNQLVDQIGTIDLQISMLRAEMRPSRGEPAEGDRMQYDRLRQEVQKLVDRKADLRAELAEL